MWLHHRPFRTINRAVIEAGITSRDYLNLSPAPCGDLVTIVVASGQHIVDNTMGEATTPAWDNDEPTAAQLRAFNPSDTSGVVIRADVPSSAWTCAKQSCALSLFRPMQMKRLI